jgi:hypothetical protein
MASVGWIIGSGTRGDRGMKLPPRVTARQTEIGGAYALQVCRDDVRHTVLVWNGVKDYQRIPAPENLAMVNMGGLAFGEKVSIAQIG